MDKNTKIIVIGFGSIGQRHYRNLVGLGYENVCVYDLKKEKIGEGIKTINKLTKEELSQFKVAFICTPNHQHVKAALIAAQAKCHLFIEKPPSHNLKDVDRLVRICKKNKLITLIGCNLRFDPSVRKIKDLIDQGKVGKVFVIYLEYGRYLPYQRPKADYRKVYAANKSMGGGVILDDFHDFDLLFWFNDFKKVKRASFVFDKLSGLDMDVEDIGNCTLCFENEVIGNIKCDYLQQYKHRNCKVIGEKGNLNWDFRDNTIYFEYFNKENQEKKEKVFEVGSVDPNQMYIDEFKYFLEKIDKNEDTFNNLEKSLKVLKAILNGKKKWGSIN
ncbi:MAG: Gfo/Idh/MocA family oxidoreductase [Candidatus Nealsonbacteria bacterium]